MITVTLQEAKAKLNQLVDAARSGKEVVLMRGSKVVARLQPLSEADLEISPRLTDSQAERFWHEIEKSGAKKVSSPKAAVQFLKKRNVM
jgi:prevent-host-death family protein